MDRAPGIPARIGPYAVERRLGSGGMGTVYLARDPTGRSVAIKVIHEHLRADPGFRARFAAEVAAARRVAGFCTVRVLDADVTGVTPYLVSEYVPGPSLHDLVSSHGALSTSDLEALAVGVAAALTAIHATGIVHRDLTPRNVLLSPFGPKVIDFGIARPFARSDQPATIAWGTPGWVAPEQLSGRPVGPAADVYAWGLLIAWAGTGRHPLENPDLNGLEPKLATLVAEALRTDPAARPHARDLLLRLCGSTDDSRIRTAIAPLSAPPAAVAAAPALGKARPLSRTRRLPPPAQPIPVKARRGGRTQALVVLLCIGMLALCILGVLHSLGQPDTEGTDSPGPGRTTTKPAPKGPPVARDGDLEFTVTKLDCGQQTLKNITQKSTKGQFCVLTMRVRNFKGGGGRIWPSSQQLIDTDGNDYRADDLAWLYHGDATGPAKEIGSGKTVTAILVYDTPNGSHFGKVVVRDSPLSLGTDLALR